MMTERPRTAGGRRRGRPPAAPPSVLLPAVLSCRVCHALFVPHHTDGPTGAAAATGVAAAPPPRVGTPGFGPVPTGVAAGPIATGTAPDRYCSKACRRTGSRRER